MLDRLGLTDGVVLAYRHIVRHAGIDAAELARLLGQDAQEAAGVVDVLAHHGLVSRIRPDVVGQGSGDSAVERLRPVNPVVALAELLGRHEDELRRRELEVQQLRTFATSFAEEYRAARDQQGATVLEQLPGREDVVARLAEIFLDVRDEIRTFVTNRQPAAALAEARERDLDLLARGIRIRVLCLTSVINDRENLDYLRWFAGQGAEIRTVPTLPLRLILQDDEVAVVAASPDEPERGAVLVRGAGLLCALGALFDSYWRSGTSVAGCDGRSWARGEHAAGGELDAVQREIVGLLARGAKDELIARQMGVSVRTVRRLISELAARLGVESRFAFGVEAARQGWVEPA